VFWLVILTGCTLMVSGVDADPRVFAGAGVIFGALTALMVGLALLIRSMVNEGY